MRFMALMLVSLLLAGCGLVDGVTMSPSERINAALPPIGAGPAEARLMAMLESAGDDVARVRARWQDQLIARALRCSAGYRPGLFDTEDGIRAALVDKACFAEADRVLVEWLHWRIAALLLAAPPLRPVPAEFPVAFGTDVRVQNVRFADAAGVAVLQTDSDLVLVEITGSKVLAHFPANQQRMGQLSPNGRLLAVGTAERTRFVDTETGEQLLDLETSEAANLHWLDAQTAITGKSRGTGSMLLDFRAGRTVAIPWMRRAVAQVAAEDAEAGIFVLVYSDGISRMRLERSGDDVQAVPLAEQAVTDQYGFWQGSFTPDGHYYFSTVPSPLVVDTRTLAVTKLGIYPLSPEFIEKPGPARDEILFGVRSQGGQSMTLLFRPSDDSLRIVHDLNIQRGDYEYVRSLGVLAKKDGSRVVRVDPPETGEPTTAPGLSAAALDGKFDVAATPAAVLSLNATRAPRTTAGPAADGPWVEAVGVYQGKSPRRDTPADVLVEVRSSSKKDRILVLSSYESVRWRVFGAGAASLKAVYVASYKPSTVTGTPDSIPVKILGSMYAYQRGDAAFMRLQGAVTTELGKGIDSFQGTYEGLRFTVGP